ncbi:MAG TPA: type IV toxin-antitoxin system AbiEi family antitoxin domain-containing protein, partial [Acidimicrobiia bacterium]|nr:type IV toxin-antitoxin system AbiEi family antitoxin domain-containing protein [Acidimicrobiia bacterium]
MQSSPSSPRSPDGPDVQISRFAADHHGVFPRSVALEAGATPRQITRRLASGRWARVYDEVYRSSGSPTSARAEVTAALFAVGPGAFASHRTGAHLWGLPGGRE